MKADNHKLISLFELSIDSQRASRSKQEESKNLRAFREHLHENKKSHHHLPYTTRKKSVMTYRMIFFGLSTLFTLLSLLIFFKTQASFTHVIFGTFSTFKTVVLTTSGFLSFASFAIGFSMHTEKEVANHHIKQAKIQLRRIYTRKQIQFGITEIFSLGRNRALALTLKQLYKEAINKIEEHSDETYSLLDQISESDSLDSAKKEELMNQAIIELKSKLDDILHLFQNIDISKLN